MKKAPSQSRTAMRVRVQYAYDRLCWMSFEENGYVTFAIQPIEMWG